MAGEEKNLAREKEKTFFDTNYRRTFLFAKIRSTNGSRAIFPCPIPTLTTLLMFTFTSNFNLCSKLCLVAVDYIKVLQCCRLLKIVYLG